MLCTGFPHKDSQWHFLFYPRGDEKFVIIFLKFFVVEEFIGCKE